MDDVSQLTLDSQAKIFSSFFFFNWAILPTESSEFVKARQLLNAEAFSFFTGGILALWVYLYINRMGKLDG